MGVKEDIEQGLQAYADTSGNLDLRMAFGTPGYRIQVRNEVENTGQVWYSPSFIRGLIQAIAEQIGQFKEEFFELNLNQTLISLNKRPISNAEFLCGKHLLVYKNGSLLEYKPALENNSQFDYLTQSNQIKLFSAVSTDRLHVLYRY